MPMKKFDGTKSQKRTKLGVKSSRFKAKTLRVTLPDPKPTDVSVPCTPLARQHPKERTMIPFKQFSKKMQAQLTQANLTSLPGAFVCANPSKLAGDAGETTYSVEFRVVTSKPGILPPVINVERWEVTASDISDKERAHLDSESQASPN